jgi:hypothetical protein
MGESLEQASRERDETRSRMSELEQRLRDALSESERLRAEMLRQEKEPGAYSGSAPAKAAGRDNGVPSTDPVSDG